MNEREAAAVMAQFSAAFGREVTAAQMATWHNACLVGCPPEVGLEVVRRIVGEDQRFPSPARFNEVRRAVERRSVGLPELPAGGKASPEFVKRIVAETRARLRGDAA